MEGHGELKAFCPFSYKRGPQVNDLSDSWPPCRRQTASCSHDRPLLWVNGGRDWPVCPCLDPPLTVWNCECSHIKQEAQLLLKQPILRTTHEFTFITILFICS